MKKVLLFCLMMVLCSSAVFAGTPAPYSYAFTTWSSTAPSTPVIVDGWTNYSDGNYTTGHNAPNSVKLGNSGKYIISPAIDNPDVMSVWLKGNGTAAAGTFTISAQISGDASWTVIKNCTFGTTGDIRNNTYYQSVIALGPAFRGMNNVLCQNHV